MSKNTIKLRLEEKIEIDFDKGAETKWYLIYMNNSCVKATEDYDYALKCFDLISDFSKRHGTTTEGAMYPLINLIKEIEIPIQKTV